MEITQTRDGEVAIFAILGRLDSHSAPELDRQIMAAIDGGQTRLVIDCAGLDYITSAGLRVLNKTAKKLARSDGRLVLSTMEDYVREVFEIAGFDAFLAIVPDRDAALALVREPGGAG
jgi:anti-sigma B factor antagonist